MFIIILCVFFSQWYRRHVAYMHIAHTYDRCVFIRRAGFSFHISFALNVYIFHVSYQMEPLHHSAKTSRKVDSNESPRNERSNNERTVLETLAQTTLQHRRM